MVNQDSSSDRRLLPNKSLFLSRIQKYVDEGIYTCVAINDVPNEETGEAESTAEASIELVVVRKCCEHLGTLTNNT